MLIRFASKFLILALNQAKIDYLANQYKMEPEDVVAIAEYDPSPKDAFTAWLCKLVKEGRPITYLETLKEPLQKFIRLQNSPDFPADKRDIMRYKPEELLTLVGNERRFRRNLSQAEIERMIMKEGIPGAKMIWNGSGFKMWEVTRPEYARFLSSNTNWCTAQEHYSISYCESGQLYPIYFKDKPLAQGHITSDESSGVSFLGKDDRDIQLYDPIIVGMLSSIKNPEMARLRRKALNEYNVSHNINGKAWSEIEPLANMVLEEGMRPAIIAVAKAQVWPEGLEFLLDYPAALGSVVERYDSSQIIEVHKKAPELFEEIVHELKTLDASLVPKWMLTVGDDSFITDFESIKDISNVDFKSDKVETILIRRINGLSERDGELEHFMTSNNNWGSTNSVFTYWNRFLDRAGVTPAITDKLKGNPQYTERVEALKGVKTSYSIGDIVELGPDYKGEKTGPVTIIKKLKTQSIYEVRFVDKTKEKLTQLPGRWEVGRVLPKIMNPQPAAEDIKPGDRVIIGTTWTAKYVPKKDEIGTIKKVSEGRVTIKWENGETRNTPVANLIFIEPPKDILPLRMMRGTEIKPGPTWRWGNQDSATTGIIMSDQGGQYWVSVRWGNGGENNYRYGYDYSDFNLDVVPVDFEFSHMSQKDIKQIQKEMLDRVRAENQ